MKNRKHYDNSSMSIQIKFKNKEREVPDTDVNGNDNTFLSSESEAIQCHEHMTALEKQLSEKQAKLQNKKRVKRQDARKLPPLRISKTRLPSLQETNKNNNSTSYLHQHLKTKKSAVGQSSFKAEEKCKNIFSDFSMSHFSEMRHARTDISVKIGANQRREAKDKQLQNYPKLQVSLTLNENEREKNAISRTETDIVHSVRHDNMNGNPQSLSIVVCEYDTNDDNSELTSKSPNLKLTDTGSLCYNTSTDEGPNAGDPIPQLSPIHIHRADNSFMLPSPQYSLQPPVLTPISDVLSKRFEDHDKFFTLKTEIDTQEPSALGNSQNKSSRSLTPVHISAIKKTLKRTTCQAMENTSVDRNMCEFKEKSVSLQRPHEFPCNGSEQNGSEVFENQKLHYDLKTVDNAVTIRGKDDPTKLLALSTKDTPSGYRHLKNNMSKEVTGNSKPFRYDSTVKNTSESNICNVNSKDYKSNSKSNERKEADVKHVIGNDENNHGNGEKSNLAVTTKCLASVDQTLMHSKVETESKKSELILPSQDPKLSSKSSFNDVHTVTKSSISESQRVSSSVASSMDIENQNFSTDAEQALNGRCLESPEIEHLCDPKPVPPIHETTHKRKREKLTSTANSVDGSGELQPRLIEQDSEPHCSAALTPKQSIRTSSSCRDAPGLQTDVTKTLLYETTTDQIMLEHDSQLTGAFCKELVLKPSHPYIVTLGEALEQPSHGKINPLPDASTQMCTAYEKDLFQEMYINDERQLSATTSSDSTINSTQQNSCDVRTNDATKQQSVEYYCGGSSNMLKDGLCSVSQSVASTFQSKFREAISSNLKPDQQTFHSPQHQITLTTDLPPGAMTVNTLPRDAERISPRESSHPTVSADDAFNSTIGTVLSQPAVTTVSSAGARDFRYTASNETTHGIIAVNVTTASALSIDALTSQANSLTGHIVPQKANTPHSSIRNISTKLDPDAVKNMSLHIIHHSGKRNSRCQKETTKEADRLSLNDSTQPTSVNMTSHVASASNTSQNVSKSKQTSVTSVPNSHLAKTQHSQFHMPRSESIQAKIYSPYEECVHSHSSNQSSWQQGNVDFTKNVDISKHANSAHISTQLNPVHTIAKSVSLSHCDRENFSMPHFTSSPSLNNHSFSNGFCNRTTTTRTQQPLRSENQQDPDELTSDSEPRGSLESFNSFSHIVGSDVTNPNILALHASEHPGKLSPDSSNPDSNSQTKVHQADDSSQTHEFPTEPLDLSLPKEHKRTPPCTGKVAVDLNSEHLQPDVQMLALSTATAMFRPNLSVTENITVSPGVTPNMVLSNTSSDLVSSVPSNCRNKDLFTLSNRSLTLAQNSLTNSLPATISSAKPQGLCHRSPLLETALLHNIVPKDRDPHPFNRVVPECLLPRPSSTDHRENRPLSNIQADNKASQVHHSQPVSLEPSSAPSSMHSRLPVCHHKSLVTSGTWISPTVYQPSQSLLPLLSNAKVTRHVGYNKNVESGQHTSATTTSQEQRTSSFTIQQQSANLQSQYSSAVSTLKHPSNNGVRRVGTMASKVAPLPVKDFFTHTTKENTYSALLMAKITNKNKQNSGYQKVSELLQNCQSQNTALKYSSEADDNLQRNLVIDLTVSDDDCKLIPECPQEHSSKNSTTRNLQVISNHDESLSVLELANSCASETVSPHKQNREDLYSAGLSVCVSDSSNIQNNQREKMCHESALFINTPNYNVTSQTEPYHIQEKYTRDNNESYYENIYIIENNVHSKIVSTPVIFQIDSPAASTQPNAGYSYSYTANENAIKALKTTNSREFSNSALDLKMDSPGKELMAKKLMSAMSMRTYPEERAQQGLPLPTTYVYKEGTNVEGQQSPVHSFEEGIQTSTSVRVHDNSTQRAAATLLELSANPIYNPFIISPEISGDFQEKVYQIHPVLPDQENDTWYTTQDIQNNSFNYESNTVAGTKSHKNKSCRRVGRPPKDQYSSSDSVTLGKSTSISSNAAVPSSVPTNTSQASVNDTRLLHSVTPCSFSKVIVHPPKATLEPQSPAVVVGADSLPCMFPFHYECPDKSQILRDMHGRAIATMENQSFRSDHAFNSQERNIPENSRHNTSSSPRFKEDVFASVASKTASDTMFSNTPIQTMTVNTGTHLSNGLNTVHNRNTGSLHGKSPITNISDFKNTTIPQGGSKSSIINQQSPKHSVEYSVLHSSVVSGFLTNNNAVFTKAKECTSDAGKHSRAQKRKYQNHNSQEYENVQHHIMQSEAFPNNGLPLTSPAHSFMPTECFTKESNNNNIYSEISKSNKKKRASKGRVKKRKSKARNKNSKLLHHQTSAEHDANMDNKNPQDNQVDMWQTQKYMKSVDLSFQDDEQTIQYGLQDLQVIGDSETESQRSYVPMSSTSTGFTLSENLLWKAIVASDGKSSMENNEYQKELEVTSLLASMMCSKYKGQV
ncbi:hypothetical protein BsWGS_20783 [Bradybaena similaris]